MRQRHGPGARRRQGWSPSALALAALLAPGGGDALAQPAAGGALCRAAVARAEAEAPGAALPSRLLAAIARVESGRRDPASGRHDPWPWTINAEGRGSFFPDKAAAIAAVRTLQAQGVRSIDVGCMQVNLRHHPQAFASLEEAFDPVANARYAMRFLRELHAGPAGGDWMRAASFYHSQTPEHAAAYRARLVAALAAEQGVAPPATGLAAAAPPGWPQLPGAFGLSNRPERAALRPGGRGGGRGLDAYRAAPIPLTGRIAIATALPPARATPAPLPPRPLPPGPAGPAAPRAPLIPGLPPRS